MRKSLWLAIVGFVEASNAADVRLAWNASTTAGVTNHVLYASTNALTLQSYTVRTNVGPALAATVTTLRAAQWQFAVTAMKDGVESDLSAILPVEIPLPPGGVRIVIP